MCDRACELCAAADAALSKGEAVEVWERPEIYARARGLRRVRGGGYKDRGGGRWWIVDHAGRVVAIRS